MHREQARVEAGESAKEVAPRRVEDDVDRQPGVTQRSLAVIVRAAELLYPVRAVAPLVTYHQPVVDRLDDHPGIMRGYNLAREGTKEYLKASKVLKVL